MGIQNASGGGSVPSNPTFDNVHITQTTDATGLTIKPGASQTHDLVDIIDHSNAPLITVDVSGALVSTQKITADQLAAGGANGVLIGGRQLTESGGSIFTSSNFYISGAYMNTNGLTISNNNISFNDAGGSHPVMMLQQDSGGAHIGSAYVFDTSGAYTAHNIIDIKNNAVAKVSIDKDGKIIGPDGGVGVAGGDIWLKSGNGNGVTTNSASIQVAAGDSVGHGGSVGIVGGSSTTQRGGSVTCLGGDSDAGDTGGDATLNGGGGNGGSNSGGAIVSAGGGGNTGIGGVANIVGGDGTGAEGGNVSISGGLGDSAKDGGTILIFGGQGNAGGSSPAVVELGGGSGNGQGGVVSISGGQGVASNGGGVSISSGNGDTGLTGGPVNINAGGGDAGGSVGGAIVLNGGASNGVGGDSTIYAGDAESGTNTDGGNIYLIAGQRDGSGINGEIFTYMHISPSSNIGQPSIAAQSGAGSGATATLGTFSGDTSGVINLTTGASGRSSGAQVKVTFQSPYNSPPVVVFSGANASAAANLVSTGTYVTSTVNDFTLNFGVAASGAIAFVWNYHVLGCSG